jgi:hypothetical protein
MIAVGIPDLGMGGAGGEASGPVSTSFPSNFPLAIFQREGQPNDEEEKNFQSGKMNKFL